MASKIKFRRGTAAEWTAEGTTLVLDQGEPGFEIDTGKLKVGNGTDIWNALDYVSADPGSLVGDLDDLTDVELSSPLTAGQVLKYDGVKWVNDTDLTGGTPGDIALDDLEDVTAPTPANGQALVYNSDTSQWEPRAILVADGNLDFGTFNNPTEVEIDLGTF
jgi:hypothetical protein